MGIALLDADLCYLLINPARERINGIPAADHIGRNPGDILTFLDVETSESALRKALLTGTPVIDQYAVGHIPADPDHDRAWSVSYSRIETRGGRVIGVANSVFDVSKLHRAATQADQARCRLAVIADACTAWRSS
ncbi:PAS domain-containing protein [Streptomyces sp. NPDC059819]|uniref:PAS domain-containing protein n=1 Tax=Streptomyces sp. NPDC059819 TaxID=3346963 RepID=UPI003648B16D